MNFYDAHNHLQDARLRPHLEGILSDCAAAGIARMVVNGSCEEDWPEVLALAERHSFVIPSFGYHPWYVRERTPDWERALSGFLDRIPGAIGEIGLDRWVKDHEPEDQGRVFAAQLRLAAERELPVSIHCLQAWGALHDSLKSGPRPSCGFVLHSFGGPAELIKPLEKLGAYFSLPGYFALERKQRQRDTFRQVPLDRLLIETDAPDQNLPPERVRFPLPNGSDGKPVNHPANLQAVYEFAAELYAMRLDRLVEIVEANFLRLFGALAARRALVRDCP